MIIETDSELYQRLRTNFIDRLPKNTPTQMYDILFRNFLKRNGADVQFFQERLDIDFFYATDCLGIIPGVDKIVIDEGRATWFLLKWL